MAPFKRSASRCCVCASPAATGAIFCCLTVTAHCIFCVILPRWCVSRTFLNTVMSKEHSVVRNYYAYSCLVSKSVKFERSLSCKPHESCIVLNAIGNHLQTIEVKF